MPDLIANTYRFVVQWRREANRFMDRPDLLPDWILLCSMVLLIIFLPCYSMFMDWWKGRSEISRED